MNAKQRVAKQAATYVQSDMIIGLGTGSTADCFIDELAGRQQQGLAFSVVSSSVVSQNRAKQLGLNLTSIELLNHVDLYVDGADEVTEDLTLLKGQGADLVKEKILAQNSDQFIVMVDQSKLVKRIGEKYPIPIEVIPFAWQIVFSALEKLGAKGQLRTLPGKANPMLSSHGSLILDMEFPEQITSQELNDELDKLPGIIEHGIFHDLTDVLLIGDESTVQIKTR